MSDDLFMIEDLLATKGDWGCRSATPERSMLLGKLIELKLNGRARDEVIFDLALA